MPGKEKRPEASDVVFNVDPAAVSWMTQFANFPTPDASPLSKIPAFKETALEASVSNPCAAERRGVWLDGGSPSSPTITGNEGSSGVGGAATAPSGSDGSAGSVLFDPGKGVVEEVTGPGSGN